MNSAPLLAAGADPALKVHSRDCVIELDHQSQTLISLKPKQGGGFDFAPSKLRSGDGYYQPGDVAVTPSAAHGGR